MLKVGLTGGIGSGKSTVAAIFSLLGIPVFDADSEAKKLMIENVEIRNALIGEFGRDVYGENGLNRAYLADIVFKDVLKLGRLNAIVHPVTIAAADAFMRSQKSAYAIKEAALLFEAGSNAHLDFVIAVFAPVETRIKRVMQRDQVTADQVRVRINRQMPDDMKMKLCDFMLLNDEDRLLIPQVMALHEQLLKIQGTSTS